jgi:hypothetical protein
MKTYQVNTVQDMIKCTNESNLNNFLSDLKAVIEMAHALQRLANTIAEVEGISKELAELESKGFKWIDDGKHDIKISYMVSNFYAPDKQT